MTSGNWAGARGKPWIVVWEVFVRKNEVFSLNCQRSGMQAALLPLTVTQLCLCESWGRRTRSLRLRLRGRAGPGQSKSPADAASRALPPPRRPPRVPVFLLWGPPWISALVLAQPHVVCHSTPFSGLPYSVTSDVMKWKCLYQVKYSVLCTHSLQLPKCGIYLLSSYSLGFCSLFFFFPLKVLMLWEEILKNKNPTEALQFS